MHRNYGTASPSSWNLLLMIQRSWGSHGPKHQFCFQIQAKGGRTVSNNESLSHCCNHLHTVLTDVFMVSGSFPVRILGSVALLVHSHVQTLLPKGGPSGGCFAGTSPPHAPGSVLSFIQTIFSAGDFLIDTLVFLPVSKPLS